MTNRMTRRAFTQTLGAAGAIAGASASPIRFLGSSTARASSGDDNILVLVDLNGGFDGLDLIVPHSMPTYYSRRPSIAVSPANVIDIDGRIGLNRVWQSLHDSVWTDGQMAIVEKVGYQQPSQSHFRSMEVWTSGRRYRDPSDRQGWLARLADAYITDSFEWMGIGQHIFEPMALHSYNQSIRPLVVGQLGGFKLDMHGSSNDAPLLREFIDEQLSAGGARTDLGMRVDNAMAGVIQSIDQVAAINSSYTSTVTYPSSAAGTTLAETAKVLQAGLGTRVVYTSLQGFDTHANQAARFSTLFTDLGAALQAFIDDLKAMGLWNRTTIVVHSEFGRNCFENGSGGTDHGKANDMFVMGGNVIGGLYGSPLIEADLAEHNLPYGIDFRSVFREVVRDHMGWNPDIAFDESITENDATHGLFA